MGNSAAKNALPELQHVASCDTNKMLGTWFVIGVKPTMFETTCSNAVEKYTRQDDKKNFDIDIDFKYNKNEDPLTSPLKSLPQKGWLQGEDKENTGLWKVRYAFTFLRFSVILSTRTNVSNMFLLSSHLFLVRCHRFGPSKCHT